MADASSSPPGVTLSEIRPFALTQLAAWPETLPRMAAEVARIAGAAGAPGPCRGITGDKAHILRVDPLKWWLIHDPDLVPGPLPDPEIGVMLDLSSARSRIAVEGPAAEDLLGQFLPLDLRSRAFPEGKIAVTAFRDIGVVLWRTAKGFNLLIPRSFATALCDQMAESARQYSVEIG